MFTDVVILAGGFGERLWPASKADFPKQFMALDGGISFLQHSILRSLALNPRGKIVIATRLGLENEISKQCEALFNQVTEEQKKKLKNDLLIISEPFPKHTTAPILLCSMLLKKLDSSYKHSMLVLTSDHIIGPVSAFVNDAERAFKSAIKNHIVTFGIQPYEPSVGYGYILTGNMEEDNPSVFKINEFKEKPDQKTAEAYIAAGNCRWNSGMFAFDCDFFEEELGRCTPEVTKAFESFKSSSLPSPEKIGEISYIKPWDAMIAAYDAVPAIAIDKSLAEKTKNAYAVLASFNWDDVGSWDSFEKHCKEKDNNSIFVDSHDCFVYSDIPVALCGVNDVTVVIKNGKALVMRKGCSNLVREAAKKFN